MSGVPPPHGVKRYGRVDVPVRHPPSQHLRGHVDRLHLVRPAHHGVGHRLLLHDAGDGAGASGPTDPTTTSGQGAARGRAAPGTPGERRTPASGCRQDAGMLPA